MIDSGRSGRFPLTRVLSIGRFRSSAFYMGVFSLVNLRHSRISSRTPARVVSTRRRVMMIARVPAPRTSRARPRRAHARPPPRVPRARARLGFLARRLSRVALRVAPLVTRRAMVFGIGGNDKENASPTNAATPAPGKADAGRKAGKPLATPDILAAMLDSDSEDESVRARAPPDTPARSDRIPPPRRPTVFRFSCIFLHFGFSFWFLRGVR